MLDADLFKQTFPVPEIIPIAEQTSAGIPNLHWFLIPVRLEPFEQD